MKNLSDKKIDPSVECLTRLFPEDFIRNTASETGFIQRERKIDPVILFWVIVLGFGVNFLRTIRGLKRKYENESDIQMSISSFNDRFTPQMEKFLKKCVTHALECQAQEPGLKLGSKLRNFKDILIQDSTGLKLSCVVSAVADGVKTVIGIMAQRPHSSDRPWFL